MKRILTAIAVLLMACATVFAQGGYQVKGVVVDDMGPVIGAAVVQQGTTNGTSTGIDGDFVLTVPNADAMIEISCIGYATQVFKASEVPSTITLAEDSHFLDEVVVIGYGTVKKSDLTGSVSTVKADEINKGVITSPTDLLRGKSAGVVVTAGNGMPGSAPTVRIRGGSSINASNTPLYVIDGLPVSNDGISGMADPMASINPEDIESFSVLKDASATAIYGSRASNGVIVITTKKGSKSSSTMPRVAADFTTSINTIAKYNNVLDADGIVNLIRDFYGVNSAAEQHLGVAGKLYNTDWQKEIYRIATTVDANMSLTGKLGFLPYRISTGVLQQKGTLKGSEMDRLALGLNLSPSFFDNHLTVNVNGKGTYALNWYADQGAIGSANHYDPTKPVYNDVPGYSLNGFTAWYDQSGNINGMATQNPVAQLASRYDTADTYRFIGNTQFDYKIHQPVRRRFPYRLRLQAYRHHPRVLRRLQPHLRREAQCGPDGRLLLAALLQREQQQVRAYVRQRFPRPVRGQGRALPDLLLRPRQLRVRRQIPPDRHAPRRWYLPFPESQVGSLPVRGSRLEHPEGALHGQCRKAQHPQAPSLLG